VVSAWAVHGPKARPMVDQVHLSLFSPSAHEDQVQAVVVAPPPFLFFRQQAPAGGELGWRRPTASGAPFLLNPRAWRVPRGGEADGIVPSLSAPVVGPERPFMPGLAGHGHGGAAVLHARPSRLLSHLPLGPYVSPGLASPWLPLPYPLPVVMVRERPRHGERTHGRRALQHGAGSTFPSSCCLVRV
jgi:hypothetical protein